MSQADFRRPPADRFDVRRPSMPDGATYPYSRERTGYPYPLAPGPGDGGETRPAGDGPGGSWGRDEGGTRYPRASTRVQFRVTDSQEALPARESGQPWPPAPYPAHLKDAAPDKEEGSRGPGGRRWLLPAGLVTGAAALGAAAVLMTGGQPGGHPGAQGPGGMVTPSAVPSVAPSAMASMAARMKVSPSPSGKTGTTASASVAPPVTMAQAQAVLAGYTTANNNANAQRSDTLLAATETGSSFAIDAGLYRAQRAEGTSPYPAYSPAQATYYIPGNEPVTGPRWFVVQVANAFTSDPGNVTTREYLLFTQASPGAAWQDTIEPYLLSPAGAPKIAVGADGHATALSPGTAADAVSPGQLPAVTAASLDGTGAGKAAVADPGDLGDRANQQALRAEVPGGTVTDTHTAATGADGQEFALLTADGGALVFYTDAATLTAIAPAGSAFRISVPGIYSSRHALTRASLSYLEQFAAYDPPAASGGTPRIVADYSGINGGN